MYSTETEIHDQAYQFFKQEAPEFLQTIETGLLSLREDRSTNNIHAIMRAAHSIKGGSASLNLEGIKTIAHQLEDVFRSLYRFEGEIDADLEGLLFQAYDCLRLPLMDQLQSGHYEEASAIETAEPIFEVLKLYLGDTDEDTELPTAAELGVDIVQIVFDGDVQQGILRLQNVLDNPEGVPVKGEIRAQVEVFSGIGELLNLSGFQAIAHATLQALEHHPDNPILVGKVAIANFVAARAEVLAGDRAQGGQPSPELIALTQTNQSPTVQSPASPPQQSVAKLNDNPPNLDLVFDIEESDDQWFQSLEQELNIFSSANLDLEDTSPSFLEEENLPSPDLNLDLKGATNLDLQNFEQLSYDSLDEIISPETDSEIIDKSLETEEFESFDSLNLNLEDLNFEDINLEENLDQNFEVFSARLDDKNDDLELNIFDIADDIVEVSQLSNFFGEQESVLGETPSKSDQYLADLEINAITQNLIAPPTPIISTASSIIQSKTAIANSKNVTTNVTTTTTSKKNPKNLEKAAPYISETIRVDLSRLERLNNFSSELVTQENASILHHQQLQAKIERLQKQFKGFENLSKNLQTWLDKAQRSQVRTQNFSPVSSLNLFNKPQLAETLSNTANLLADFDPLQMDSYNRLYGVIQEALEEIAQMDEGMRDMTVLMQQTYQTQRRKQQILKQVRYDLLWSRMLPLGDILTSLPRMVREMSNKYNKQVNLKMFGTGTLVDKSVLEKLYDPFVHLVRNAFDHGTESTQERLERGKPVIASIEIRAYYRGNQTYIEIKDDGHGINLEKVKSKAITVGLLKPEKADQLTNEEVYQLLFEPSFSTAEVVSELSGRGMGLSTVQEQVRSLKGSIEIKSEVGQGTTFIIKLPLTLSIAKLLIFSIQDRLLAIPIDTLLGINTVDEDAIQNIQGEKFYRFENRLIPLYPTSMFEDGYPLPKKSIELLSTEAFTDEEQTTLLLLSNGDEIFALPIDRVLNEQELAIKPFGKAIAPPPYLYGCTILGDGTLVPVIDSTALLSNKQSKTTSRSTSSNLPSASNQSISTKTQLQPIQRKTILIVDDSLTTRQALYLTLEKFGYQIIQAVDGREALDQLSRSTEIQAVLCDVEMPNMNGFEFLTACRKESRFAHLPIVMVTSRGGAKHRGVAQMLGASGYLTKPYLEQELIKTLQNLLPKL